MKIAIYGGSFDPPHLGHVGVIEAALDRLDIDLLVVVPTYINPFKTTCLTPPQVRLKWLQKLCSSYDKVEVSSFEIDNDQATPTIETVKALQLRYNLNERPYVIIGADNLKRLPSWHRYDELRSLVDFVIASRDQIEVDSTFRILDVDVPINSTFLRENIDTTWLPKVLQEDVSTYFKEQECKKD